MNKPAPKTDKTAEIFFRATYRLQLRKEFRLQDAAALTDYLEELGISHLFLSPVLEAKANSNHGYDGTDPTRISEERGGEAGFEKLIKSISKRPGLDGVLLDVVPNHLAADMANPAWWDFLKHGSDSRYFKTFDFRPRYDGDQKIILPILGKNLYDVLASREIFVDLEGQELVFQYYDKSFPLSPKSYALVLNLVLKNLRQDSGLSLSSKEDSLEALGRSPKALKTFRALLKKLSLKDLEDILREQHFSLRDWRDGNREINYRRFFDVNDLAAIRIEDSEVFDWAHSKIRDLARRHPHVHGLRIDHIDGLNSPKKYLQDLREISPYVWVEKMVAEGEKLPGHWPVTGSTGYEFTNMSSHLFVDVAGAVKVHSHYNQSIDDRWEGFQDCVYYSKREIMDSHFPAELKALARQFYKIAESKNSIGFSFEDLQEALTELTSSLHVYRTYATRGEPIRSPWLDNAMEEIENRGRLQSKKAFHWLRSILQAPGDWNDETYAAIKRWEQLTGPAMAKGLEDTAIYRYCPVLSLNGVGGEPDWIGDGLQEFHDFNQERWRTHPQSMSTTTTHDTKRSEDVRSRIHVLSEFAPEWIKNFASWHRMLSTAVTRPSLKDAYMIFETITGTWPTEGKINDEYIGRLQAYFTKAAREAKTESSWNQPNHAYEEILFKFIHNLLKPKDPKGRKLLLAVQKFAEKCAYFGAFNSLSSVTLKAMSPGLPDFYQGCELWDLSLVDPDNRRAVDYVKRRKYLKDIKEGLKKNPLRLRERLLEQWRGGEVKLWLTHQLLQLRKQDPRLFVQGGYLALEPQGEGKDHFVSFLRHFEDHWVLVVVPKFLPRSEKLKESLSIRSPKVLSVEFVVPANGPSIWVSALTGEEISGQRLSAKDLLAGMPVGVWTGRTKA